MKTAELNGTGVLLHMNSPKDGQIDRQVGRRHEPPNGFEWWPALGTTRHSFLCQIQWVSMQFWFLLHAIVAHGTNFSISAVVHVRIFWGSPKPAENLRQPDWEFGRLRCRKLTCRSQPCTLSLCTFSLFLYMKLALFWHGPVLDFLRTPEGCPLCGGLFCPLFLYILFLFSPIGNMSTCGVFSKALSFETVLAQPQRVEVFSRIWQYRVSCRVYRQTWLSLKRMTRHWRIFVLMRVWATALGFRFPHQLINIV